MKKISVLLLTTLLAVTVRAEDKPATPAAAPATAPKPSAHKPEEIVARVGKTEIKWSDVDLASRAFIDEMASRGRGVPEEQVARLQYDVMEEMVTRELVLQQAAGHEPADLEARVKDQVDQVKLQTGGDEGLTKALAEKGMTRDEFVKRIHEGLVIQETIKKFVDEKTKVSAADCQKFYDENRSKFVVPEQVRASHVLILVPEGATDEVKAAKLAQIKAALALVKGGTPFAEVAEKFSEDPGSKAKGGDLDFLPKGRLVPEFEAVAFSLKKDEVSDIVTTQYGYHIIKVTDRKPAGELTYTDVKPKIESYLKDTQGQQVAQQYLKDLRDKSKVEVLLPEPPPLPIASHAMPPTMMPKE